MAYSLQLLHSQKKIAIFMVTMNPIRILLLTVPFLLGCLSHSLRAQDRQFGKKEGQQTQDPQRVSQRSSQPSLDDDDDNSVPIPSHYLFVYSEPLAAIDFVNGGSYRLGAEYGWKKWGVYATAGGYYEQGYIVRGGFKRYFHGDEDDHRHSLGLEYLHAWHVHTVKDWYAKPDSTNPEGAVPDKSRPSVTYTDVKHITTLTLLYTYQEFWRYGWVLELYAGAGVKWRTGLVNIPQTLQDQLYYFHHTDYVEPESDTRGNSIQFDIRAGVKIGYTLWAR
jgi:hypothetical protein